MLTFTLPHGEAVTVALAEYNPDLREYRANLIITSTDGLIANHRDLILMERSHWHLAPMARGLAAVLMGMYVTRLRKRVGGPTYFNAKTTAVIDTYTARDILISAAYVAPIHEARVFASYTRTASDWGGWCVCELRGRDHSHGTWFRKLPEALRLNLGDDDAESQEQPARSNRRHVRFSETVPAKSSKH